MHREYRERCPRHRLQRKPLVNDPGKYHGTCVTHEPLYMLGSLTRGGGDNVPGFPGACATPNLRYLVRGPWPLERQGKCLHDTHAEMMSPAKIWMTYLNHTAIVRHTSLDQDDGNPLDDCFQSIALDENIKMINLIYLYWTLFLQCFRLINGLVLIIPFSYLDQ